MESERSTWTAKEKAYLEAKQKLNICNKNNCKLSEDLIKVTTIEFPLIIAHLPCAQSILCMQSLVMLCGFINNSILFSSGSCYINLCQYCLDLDHAMNINVSYVLLHLPVVVVCYDIFYLNIYCTFLFLPSNISGEESMFGFLVWFFSGQGFPSFKGDKI